MAQRLACQPTPVSHLVAISFMICLLSIRSQAVAEDPSDGLEFLVPIDAEYVPPTPKQVPVQRPATNRQASRGHFATSKNAATLVPEFHEIPEDRSWFHGLGTSGGWLQVEALTWWTTPADLPALVTTSPAGTAQSNAGVLGQSGTQTLFGGSSELDDSRNGLRIRGGLFLDRSRTDSIDGEFFFLTEDSAGFSGTSSGDPILARPFINALNGQQDAQLIAYPGLTTGTVNAKLESSLKSFAIRYSGFLTCNAENEADCVRGIQTLQTRWCGVRAGYRFIDLDESLRINESFTSIPTAEMFEISDHFAVDNRFHGLELGIFGGIQRGRFEVDAAFDLALGVTQQETQIAGQTRNTQGGSTTVSSGGLLAQRTNSGDHERNQFSMVPHFELTGAYRPTLNWKVTLAYNLLYWHEVLRVGDQIDPMVNPNLFPPELVPFDGPLSPSRRDRESGYLAHGLSFGAEYRW